MKITLAMKKELPRTIDDHIAEMERERQRQDAAAIEAIRRVHSAGGMPVDPTWQRSPGRIDRTPGSVAKFSPGGRFIGWYREDQRSGRPSKLMPVEEFVDEQHARYYRMLRVAYLGKGHFRALGERSGAKRAQAGAAARILQLKRELIVAGVPGHKHAKLIAKQLRCSVRWVREVLRAAIASGDKTLLAKNSVG